MFSLNLHGHDEWVRFQVTPGGYAVGGGTLVRLVDEFGEVIATLSVNLPNANERLPEGCFWLKDWSENRPVVEALMDAGWLEFADDVEPQQSGFVTVFAARIVP